MFYAHIIQASFQQSVYEAATATCPRRTRSQTRAYYRRKAAATGLVVVEDVEMSVPPPVEVDEEAATSSPRPKKHVCFSGARDAAATALWRASAFDAIVEREKMRVKAFIASRSAVVSLQGFGVSLSVQIEVNDRSRDKIARIVEELRGLSVGGSPGGRSSTLKRSFGEI